MRIVPLPSTALRLYDGAFIDTAVAADQHVVFDDDGQRSDRFQNSADLRGRRDVASGADLGAASDQRVRIDHRAVAYICADIDIHRRHAGDAFTDIAAVANAGATGNDADAAVGVESLHRVGGFVEPGLTRGVDGHIDDRAQAEAEKNALFHPAIDAPASLERGVGFGGADRAAVQGGLEFVKEAEMLFGVLRGFVIEDFFDFVALSIHESQVGQRLSNLRFGGGLRRAHGQVAIRARRGPSSPWPPSPELGSIR